jgi:hypothetical protein
MLGRRVLLPASPGVALNRVRRSAAGLRVMALPPSRDEEVVSGLRNLGPSNPSPSASFGRRVGPSGGSPRSPSWARPTSWPHVYSHPSMNLGNMIHVDPRQCGEETANPGTAVCAQGAHDSPPCPMRARRIPRDRPARGRCSRVWDHAVSLVAQRHGLELLENAAATAGALVAIILAIGPVSGAHLTRS